MSLNKKSGNILARVGFLVVEMPLVIVFFNRVLGWVAGEAFFEKEDCPATECLLCTIAISPMVETLIFQCLIGKIVLVFTRSTAIAIAIAASIFGSAHYWSSPSVVSVLSATLAGLVFSSICTFRMATCHVGLAVSETYLTHACTNTFVWLTLPSACQYRNF